MNYQPKEWLGSWQNFENYLVSTAPAMQACWTQAEEAAKALPMFQAGVKTFWQRAYGTALALSLIHILWPVGQAVNTASAHAVNVGSIPARVTC